MEKGVHSPRRAKSSKISFAEYHKLLAIYFAKDDHAHMKGKPRETYMKMEVEINEGVPRGMHFDVCVT